MNTKNTSIRTGSSLNHGKAHSKDHARWSRRSFLTQTGMAGAASFLFGGMSINPLASSPVAHALSNVETDRVLVLIQLKGGNDGLNTIIPLYDYSFYANQRPDIRIRQNDLFKLSDEIGMPKYAQPLERMWRDGDMKVLHSVGYPDQNLSHFRSTDIWTSASNANELIKTGWLGRWMDGIFPDFVSNPPVSPPAVQIGGFGNLALKGNDINMAVSVADPEELAEIAENGQLYDPGSAPATCYGNEVKFLRTITNNTFQYAEVIKEAFDASNNAVEYPDEPIGEQLAMVARLIKGRLGTRLYLVSIDGFDTHANQNYWHPFLWDQLSKAIQAFYDDLAASQAAERVLSLTFSEFGRRIEQNGSQGTDHGSAAPLFLFGPALTSNGFLGKPADMRNPDTYDNLIFDIDFRQVYASVLEDWLGVPQATVDGILGNSFDRLNLGLDVSTSNDPRQATALTHEVRYGSGNSGMVLYYHLPKASRVEISIHNLAGQRVQTLMGSNQAAGSHQARINASGRLSSGTYLYRIHAFGKVFAGKFMIY